MDKVNVPKYENKLRNIYERKFGFKMEGRLLKFENIF